MNPHTLSAAAELLNRKGCNYTVFLQSYSAPLQPGASSEQLIVGMLGDDAVVEQIQTVTPDEVLTEIRSSLCYAGDSGAGPDPETLRSERFTRLLSALLAEVEAVSRQATRVEQFCLLEGHPAYRVFWDFLFLFTGPSEAVALIGSSSD